MVKLTNKEHELQQKNRIDKLENRIKNLEQSKLKK